MSIHTHRGHLAPMCRQCSHIAETVVAQYNGEAEPYCFPCANSVLENVGGREYPVEEFYTAAEDHVSEFDPDGDETFDLFDPDDAHVAWMSADNATYNRSSVDLRDAC